MSKAAEESARRAGGMLESRTRKEAAMRAIQNGALDVPWADKETLLRVLDGDKNALESRRAGMLEAIVRLTGRPPLLVENDDVKVGDDLGALPAETTGLIHRASPLVKSVGRVQFFNHELSWGGTGWVVDAAGADRFVVTNRHVAAEVCTHLSTGRAVFARSRTSGVRYGAALDFNSDPDATPKMSPRAPVTAIVYLADDAAADVALLRISVAVGQGDALPPPLSLAAHEAKQDELVALVGYPAYDTRNDANAMGRYFRHLYDVKRFAPGLIMQTAEAGVIRHDCTSLGGNSGSPLISLESRKVVGLHFAGVYGVENSAVGVDTLKQLFKHRTLVTVALPPVEPAAGAGEGRGDGKRPAAHFALRNGFDTEFLGEGDLETPWPGVSDDLAADLARPSDATEARPHELRYTHFGVMFSQALRLPVMTAVNIDGQATRRIKRTADKWWYDERIPTDFQYGSKAYDDRLIDRGHMVRREDPNWGDLAEQANDDTFHYTNAAPQHSKLNQGKAMWLGLESYILDSARTEGFRVNVFTGPVCGPEDPVLVEEGMTVPLEFWKVAVMKAAGGGLHATAYLLSQGDMIRRLMEGRGARESVEGFVLGSYRTFQIRIADLQTATGHRFGRFADFDAFAKADEARLVVRAINRADDLIL